MKRRNTAVWFSLQMMWPFTVRLHFFLFFFFFRNDQFVYFCLYEVKCEQPKIFKYMLFWNALLTNRLFCFISSPYWPTSTYVHPTTGPDEARSHPFPYGGEHQMENSSSDGPNKQRGAHEDAGTIWVLCRRITAWSEESLDGEEKQLQKHTQPITFLPEPRLKNKSLLFLHLNI